MPVFILGFFFTRALWPLSKKKIGPSKKIRAFVFADRLQVTLIPSGIRIRPGYFEKCVNIVGPQCIFSSSNFRFDIFLINGAKTRFVTHNLVAAMLYTKFCGNQPAWCRDF